MGRNKPNSEDVLAMALSDSNIGHTFLLSRPVIIIECFLTQFYTYWKHKFGPFTDSTLYCMALRADEFCCGSRKV
jgi:hypothetical protein